MPLPCSHLIVHALPPRRLAGLADLDRDQVLRVQGQLELEEHHQVHQGGESCSHRSSVHAARNLLSLMLAPLLCRTPRASWRAAAGTSSTLIRATRRTTPSPSRSSSRGTLALIHALRTRSDATHRSPLAHRSASTSLPCSGSDDGESEDEESSEDESLVESDDDSEYGGEDEEDGAAGGEQGGEKGKREGRKERWSLGRAATDALAAGMLVTILLDAWRLCFGGIVPVSELPARRLRLPWML